jgi:O-antigen/teichoic acid export membrane protein
LYRVFLQNRKHIKELFQVGLGQGLAALGGIVGVRLLTYVMAPVSYGELALSMTFLLLVQQVIMGPVTNGFARYFTIAQEKGSVNEYLKSVRHLLVKSSSLTLLVYAISLVGLALSNNWYWAGLLSLTFLYTLVVNYNIALDNIQNAALQRIIVAWHQVLSQWLRFVLAAGFILLIGSTSSIAMLGYLVSAIVVIASQWYFFKRIPFTPTRGGGEIPRDVQASDWEHQIIQFALPFSMWGIFTWAQMSADRWALQTFESTTTVGLYTVIYQLGYYPVILLTGVFVQFISPLLYRRVGDATEIQKVRSTQRFTNRLVIGALIFTGILIVFAWLLKGVIFRFLVAPEYWEVSYLLPAMTLSGGLFAAGQISTLTALNNKQPHILLKPKIITGVLGVMLSFIGAYFWALNGVVGAGIVFGLIYLIWVYWLFRH